ncbi:hypothetical protein TNCV_4928691 [Trichonephila clavipes]|nr:hypothetical protein TNCV_4928691 [Trichonephila clavipes]
MTPEHQTDMELAHSTSLTSSRSSTPTRTNCERLQMVQTELRKFSIMLSGVTHTTSSIAPYSPDDDPEQADLYAKQAYLDERQQQAMSEYLFLAVTPWLSSTLSTSLNSPTKVKNDEFPELPKKVSFKRRESEDGFISPTSRQQLEFRNFYIEINNRFSELKENDKDIAGHSQLSRNTININPSTTKVGNNTNNDNTNAPSTLPPPVFLKIEKH